MNSASVILKKSIKDIFPNYYRNPPGQVSFVDFENFDHTTEVIIGYITESRKIEYARNDLVNEPFFSEADGGGSGTGCCCGGAPNGGSGAYASVIMPVTAGQSYTLCAGCAYCCYTERNQMTQDGCPSYVTGPGLTNFCADGGESNLFCEAKSRCLLVPNAQSYCMYMGWCICNTGTDYCVDNPDISGIGYPNSRRDMSYQETANCKKAYGSASGGTVYGMPGQWSYFAYDYGAQDACFKHPGVVGFRDCSCCEATMNNENAGCCYQACYCQAMCCTPGAGAWGFNHCGGDTTGCADIGKTGMVCVSYL